MKHAQTQTSGSVNPKWKLTYAAKGAAIMIMASSGPVCKLLTKLQVWKTDILPGAVNLVLENKNGMNVKVLIL